MTNEVYDMSIDGTDNVRVQRSESYSQLVWRRFRKSRPAIIGGLFVIVLAMLAIFADFFAPYPLHMTNARNAFIPPTRVHFIDADGNFQRSSICLPGRGHRRSEDISAHVGRGYGKSLPDSLFRQGLGVQDPGADSR